MTFANIMETFSITLTLFSKPLCLHLLKFVYLCTMRIKEVMKEKGVGVQELAERLGVSRQTMSKQLHGHILVDTAQDIADALGVSITELFEKRPEAVLKCPHCGKEIHINISE